MQFLNAPSPSVTRLVSARLTVVIDAQFANAPLSILASPVSFAKSTLRAVQPANAFTPIEFTVPKSTVCRAVIPANAESEIAIPLVNVRLLMKVLEGEAATIFSNCSTLPEMLSILRFAANAPSATVTPEYSTTDLRLLHTVNISDATVPEVMTISLMEFWVVPNPFAAKSTLAALPTRRTIPEPLNASAPICVTLSGRAICLSAEQPANAREPMTASTLFAPKSISVRAVQFSKVLLPMAINASGRITFVTSVQPANTRPSPRSTTFVADKSRIPKEMQFANAPLPISVSSTACVKSISSDEQSSNALLPTEVIQRGKDR